jgi:hypothetical protein
MNQVWGVKIARVHRQNIWQDDYDDDKEMVSHKIMWHKRLEQLIISFVCVSVFSVLNEQFVVFYRNLVISRTFKS